MSYRIVNAIDNSNNGTRVTGLTPVVAHAKTFGRHVDVSGYVTITEIGNGAYEVSYDEEKFGDAAIQVDFTSTLPLAADRYREVAFLQTTISLRQLLPVMDILAPKSWRQCLIPDPRNPLVVPTLGSQGVLHPNVFLVSDGLYHIWMYATPYTSSAPATELASLWRSFDGFTFDGTTDVTNPLIPLGVEGSWNDYHNADPAPYYSNTLGMWCMLHAGYDGSRCAIGFATSTDGKTWTPYAGTSVDGLTAPQIIAGDGTTGQAWECSAGVSKLAQPTALERDGTHYALYCDFVDGNNMGDIGLVTFTVNAVSGDIENFQRVSPSPLITIAADSEFLAGVGHLHLSQEANETFLIYGVRTRYTSSTYRRSDAVDYASVLWTATDLTDPTTWTYHGIVNRPGYGKDEFNSRYSYIVGPLMNPDRSIYVRNGRRAYYCSGFTSQTGYAEVGLFWGVGDALDYVADKATLDAVEAKMPSDGSEIPTADENADAVRAELATELGRIDANITSRHAAGAAVAKSPATLDWSADVSNKPTIGTSTVTTDDIDARLTAFPVQKANVSVTAPADMALNSTVAGTVWAYATRTLSGTSVGVGTTAGTSDEDVYVTAFKGGTSRLTARVYSDGDDITQADVSSIAYSIYLLDDQDSDTRTVVTGHSAVALNATDVIFDMLQTDSQASNYNFCHTPPISTNAAFSTAGRNYLVEYTITPTSGQKVILRFRVNVI
jgi:hypothetical protein